MKLFIRFLSLVLPLLVVAQTVKEVDRNEGIQQIKERIKFSQLNQKSRSFHDKNWDSVNYFAQKLYDLSAADDDNKFKVLALNHLGKAKCAYADFENSKRFFKEALEVSINDKIPFIETYEGLGTLYLNWDKLDSAEIFFSKSIALAEEHNLSKKVRELGLNKGIIAIQNAYYKDAIEIFLEDYEIFLVDDDYSSLFIIYNGVGNAYFHLYDFENSQKYYKKALQTSKLTYNPVNIGKGYGNLANLYGNMQKFDSAAIYFAKSYKYFIDAGDVDRANLVRVNLLNLYVLTDESQKLLRLCKELENQPLSPEHKIILLHSKSRGLYKLERIDESAKALEEAISIAEGLDSEHSLLKLYTTSISQYLGTNNAELLNHFNKYDSILNSRFDRDNKEIMSELNTKYEVKEKEAQLMEAELENQKQKTLIYAGTGGILAIILLAGGSITYIKQKQRKLEYQKELELRALEKNMTKLNLSNLNNQIDSHDFKNTLTTVLNEVQENAPDSYESILGLLRITESALYNDSFTESLGNQLLQVEDLVRVANYQLFETIELEVYNDLEKTIELPRLILKNLVENSIRHGIKGTNTAGKIQIYAKELDMFYEIKVMDNGRGLKADHEEGLGISVYTELFVYFNKKNERKASLKLENVTNGAQAIIKIPNNYKYT